MQLAGVSREKRLTIGNGKVEAGPREAPALSPPLHGGAGGDAIFLSPFQILCRCSHLETRGQTGLKAKVMVCEF